MKKLPAIFFAFVIIFLSACSHSDPASSPADTTTVTEAESSTRKYNTITEWGTDLLPEKFPAPPKGTRDFSIVKGSGAQEAFKHTSDFCKITFICPEQEFYSFANEMTALGYKGGMKNVKNGTSFSDGFKGYWQNGENYVIISDSTAIDSGEILFEIEIAECVDNFPSALEQYFPKFNGYCMSIGYFCGHDGNGKQITEEFEGSFAMPAWHWEFQYSNCFIGVDQSEFEAYFYELEDEGFKGMVATSTTDGFTILSGGLIKSAIEGDYGVFLYYNATLKTLDVAYTNDTSIYLD